MGEKHILFNMLDFGRCCGSKLAVEILAFAKYGPAFQATTILCKKEILIT
jgi:hypothetical protein